LQTERRQRETFIEIGRRSRVELYAVSLFFSLKRLSGLVVSKNKMERVEFGWSCDEYLRQA
jgi:hypothetical protein